MAVRKRPPKSEDTNKEDVQVTFRVPKLCTYTTICLTDEGKRIEEVMPSKRFG